ncbi:MAG: DUF559 domain-containing protein [Myxococcaceae bacterium]
MKEETYKSHLRARILRRSSTRSEEILWEILRRKNLGKHKFRRQHPIGPYVIDFYCAKRQLGIELDGSIHLNSQVQGNDLERTRFLSGRGVKIIRFFNTDLHKNPALVTERILKELSRLNSPLHLVERG